MIGKKVIIRSTNSGVHFGTLKSLEGETAVLENSRRLWYWRGAFTLSAVSQRGIAEGSRISIVVPEILVNQVIEVIPCAPAAAQKIEEMEAHLG